MKKLKVAAGAVFLATSLQVNAATEIFETDDATTVVPDAEYMILDAVVAKPVHAAMVVGGFATWLVTIPFSTLSDSYEESWEKLVVEPAQGLRRCLGCTPAQDESKVLNDYYNSQYASNAQ